MSDQQHPRRGAQVWRDAEFEHTLRNQIAIVIGYCEFLLEAVGSDSTLRDDLLEIEKAARTAMHMLRKEEATEV